MDRLDTITAFVAVAELKGFAPAARRLGLSPSSVTRLVAGLEDRLGIRLLQRTTRSVTLTDSGARYLERIRPIVAALEEAEDIAQADRATPAGRLVVSAPAMFGRLHVGPLMSTYLRLHPAVVAELLLADRVVNLVEEGIDLAVRIGHLADSSLIVRKLGATRRVVVASPAYLQRRGTPAEPDDVSSHDIVQFTAIGGVGEWSFLRDGRSERVAVVPRYVSNSGDAAIGHAESGGGLTMVLAYQVADLLRAGRLKIVLAEFELPPRPIQLVYPTSRLLSAKVRTFVDMANESCEWQFTEF